MWFEHINMRELLNCICLRSLTVVCNCLCLSSNSRKETAKLNSHYVILDLRYAIASSPYSKPLVLLWVCLELLRSSLVAAFWLGYCVLVGLLRSSWATAFCELYLSKVYVIAMYVTTLIFYTSNYNNLQKGQEVLFALTLFFVYFH